MWRVDVSGDVRAVWRGVRACVRVCVTHVCALSGWVILSLAKAKTRKTKAKAEPKTKGSPEQQDKIPQYS